MNAILVSSVIFISTHMAGWLISARWVGILTGLHDGSPVVELKWYWLIPAALAVATVGVAWLEAMPAEAGRSAQRLRGSGAGQRSRRGQRRRAMRVIFRDHPARWSNRALVCTLATAFVFVVAPLAVKGLYSVSLGHGNWSVITRFLGFSTSQGCKVAATAAVAAAEANHQVCGAAASLPAAATSNGGSGSELPVLVSTFGSVTAAIVALARTTNAPWARLSRLAGRGVPTLVICAAANCTKSGDLPPGRGCVSFTFTPDDIGLSRAPKAADWTRGTRASTADYEEKAGLTLFDAVAVSGAAVSPVMGKMTRPSMRILLAAAGVRLGVWLDSPAAVDEYTERIGEKARASERRPRLRSWRRRIARMLPRWLRRVASVMRRHWLQPDLAHLWAEAAGSLHLDGRWIYVTDGGHYENLGMVEALRRTPDHLIVVDASGDEPGGFSTLGQAIALARSELGVQVVIKSIDDLKPNDKGLCSKPYVTGEFSYPDEAPGAGPHHLIYLKLTVPVSAPLDVIAYQQKHSTFPTDSTLQQLYDDQEFEAYRELGYHCAHTAVQNIVLPSRTAPGSPDQTTPGRETALANVTSATAS